MMAVLASTKVRIAAVEVGAIVVILLLHAVTGLPTAIRPVLFIFGLLVGFGVFYVYRSRYGDSTGRVRLSGAQFVSWYFVVRVASVVLMVPVMFALGLSAPLGAFVFGVVSATLLTFWTKLFSATPFFGEDKEIRDGVRSFADVGLVVGGIVIGLYLLFLGVYVTTEYILGPILRVLV